MRLVPLTAPPPVEITNHTEWWVQWLPVAGSALLAIGALVGVVLSNRMTLKISRQEREGARQLSRLDREAARQRDYLQWRRETLSRLGTEVVEAAVEAIDEYGKFVNISTTMIADSPHIDRACRRIAANGEALRLLSAPVCATGCVELRDSIMDDELNKAANEYRGRKAGLTDEVTREAKARFDEGLRLIQVALQGVVGAVESALRQLNPPEPFG